MSGTDGWRELAETLAKQVKAEVWASPQLKAEYKRVNPSQWRQVLVGLFLILFMAVAVGAAIGTMGPDAFSLVWVFFGVVVMAAVFLHTGQLRLQLERTRDRLAHTPLSDSALYAFVYRNSRSTIRTYALFFVYVVVLAFVFLPPQLMTAPVAVVLCLLVPLQAATVNLLGLVVLRWLPRRLSDMGSLTFTLLGLGVFAPIWLRGPAAALLHWLEANPWPLLLLPVNWAPHGLLNAAQGDLWALLWCLPAVALLLCSPLLQAHLRARPWGEPPEEVHDDEHEVTEEVTVEEVRDGVWLTGWGPEPNGWLLRAILLTLTPREQWVLRLLQPEPHYEKRTTVALGLLALTPLVPQFKDLIPEGLPLLCLAVAFVGLPLIDQWPGMRLVKTDGGWVPRFLFYPVAQKEIARVVLKVNAVRALVFIAPAVFAGGLFGMGMGWTFLESSAFAGRIAAIYLGLLPALSAFLFLSTLNQDRLSCRSIVIGFVWGTIAIVGAMLVLIAPGAAVVRPTGTGFEMVPKLSTLAGAAMVWGLGWGSYWVYPWIYKRTDMIRAFSSEQEALLELQEQELRKKLRAKG